MMKGILYAADVPVGTWETYGYDPGMGVASAQFHPNEEYKRIQPIIVEHTRVGPLSEYTDEQRHEAWLKVQSCKLEARTEDGETVETDGGLWLMDFSDDFKDDPEVHPYDFHMLGISRELSDKYFQDEIREYCGEST